MYYPSISVNVTIWSGVVWTSTCRPPINYQNQITNMSCDASQPSKMVKKMCHYVNHWRNFYRISNQIGKLDNESLFKWDSDAFHWIWNSTEISFVGDTLVGAGGLCSIGYLSETHLKLKARHVSFLQNIRFSCPIVLKFCTQHGSIYCRALYKISKRLGNWKMNYGQTRFGFEMRFGRISYIAQSPRFYKWYQSRGHEHLVFETSKDFKIWPLTHWGQVTHMCVIKRIQNWCIW